jgi:hypothetical protein
MHILEDEIAVLKTEKDNLREENAMTKARLEKIEKMLK